MANPVVVKNVSPTVIVKGKNGPRVVVSTKTATKIVVKSTGPQGPKGDRGTTGATGPSGPVGSFDDANLPDFTLIFQNQLV